MCAVSYRDLPLIRSLARALLHSLFVFWRLSMKRYRDTRTFRDDPHRSVRIQQIDEDNCLVSLASVYGIN